MELHFRTLDFGQVTVGSANVRNLAVTNHLPHAILIEISGLDSRGELSGSGPLSQVVPSNGTAGFDVHFSCQTEQVRCGPAHASEASRTQAVRAADVVSRRECALFESRPESALTGGWMAPPLAVLEIFFEPIRTLPVLLFLTELDGTVRHDSAACPSFASD